MTYEDAQEIITAMKSKFHDSALVGREKDNRFKSSIGAIYQTFDGNDLYRPWKKRLRTCCTS